jgi:hypothetical protein
MSKIKGSYQIVDNIIAYESGQLSQEGILELFAELIKSGKVWVLQGSYGRQAQTLIEGGYISDKGRILKW